MLFIAIDRLERAPGETSWQRFSTSALVADQNERRFGLCLGSSSDSLLFRPFLQGKQLMGSCSFFFVFIMSLCVTSGPSAPISSRFGKGLEILSMEMPQACASERLQPPGLECSLVWGTTGFRGDVPFLLQYHQRHFIHSVTLFEHDMRDGLSFEAKRCFHAGCKGQTENGRR